MINKWRLILDPAHPGPYNMAIDEALAESARENGTSTLRLYSFEPACITVGRFQPLDGFIDMTACRSAGVELTRRPTGGLAILHKDDFTYSFTCPVEGDSTALRNECFSMVARGIVESLERLGIRAEVTSHKDRCAGPGWCFEREFGVDVEWNARKICGSAQRISAGALLQHGSLFLNEMSGLWATLSGYHEEERPGGLPATVTEACGRTVGWDELAAVFREGFECANDVSFEQGDLSALEKDNAIEFLRSRYGSEAWVRGNSSRGVCDIIGRNDSAGDNHGGQGR